MQPRQEGLSEWIAIRRLNKECDSKSPVIANPDRDLFISDLAITNPEE